MLHLGSYLLTESFRPIYLKVAMSIPYSISWIMHYPYFYTGSCSNNIDSAVGQYFLWTTWVVCSIPRAQSSLSIILICRLFMPHRSSWTGIIIHIDSLRKISNEREGRFCMPAICAANSGWPCANAFIARFWMTLTQMYVLDIWHFVANCN